MEPTKGFDPAAGVRRGEGGEDEVVIEFGAGVGVAGRDMSVESSLIAVDFVYSITVTTGEKGGGGEYRRGKV
jgi:hypothetical protein